MTDTDSSKREQITAILSDLQSGRGCSSTDTLLPLVYDELKRVAQAKINRELPGQTLQGTALVHEAYLRLIGAGDHSGWENRAHFFGAASEAMRRILIDNARRKKAKKHGGEQQRVEMEEFDFESPTDDDTLLAVNEALDLLAVKDPEAAQLVKLRFFVGLTNVEAANVLGIGERTAKGMWAYARAWLSKEIRKNQ